MKRILVAVDSSQRSAAVFAAGLRLAELCDGKVIVFRAIGIPPEVPPEILSQGAAPLEDLLRRKAHEDLDSMIAAAPPGRIEKVTTALATPWDGICNAAKENDADLIVIGSHGYSGLDRLLGTTAAKVVNHADRNVFVVRTAL